jgi:Lar family restriction alleviation protein
LVLLMPEIWGRDIEGKDCPFCGGRPRMQTSHPYSHQSPVTNEKFFVVCGSCGAVGPSKKSEAAATKAWDGRK